MSSTDCEASKNYNQGCDVPFSQRASYGSAFNAGGGGFFAAARTRAEGVRIWFWPRHDPDAPPEIRHAPPNGHGHSGFGVGSGGGGGGLFELTIGGRPTIAPSAAWGKPEAAFPLGGSCDYADNFDTHQFVFDLTFCVSAFVFLVYR